jgi:hypothetical protein
VPESDNSDLQIYDAMGQASAGDRKRLARWAAMSYSVPGLCRSHLFVGRNALNCSCCFAQQTEIMVTEINDSRNLVALDMRSLTEKDETHLDKLLLVKRHLLRVWNRQQAKL